MCLCENRGRPNLNVFMSDKNISSSNSYICVPCEPWAVCDELVALTTVLVHCSCASYCFYFVYFCPIVIFVYFLFPSPSSPSLGLASEIQTFQKASFYDVSSLNDSPGEGTPVCCTSLALRHIPCFEMLSCPFSHFLSSIWLDSVRIGQIQFQKS